MIAIRRFLAKNATNRRIAIYYGYIHCQMRFNFSFSADVRVLRVAASELRRAHEVPRGGEEAFFFELIVLAFGTDDTAFNCVGRICSDGNEPDRLYRGGVSLPSRAGGENETAELPSKHLDGVRSKNGINLRMV